MPLLGHLVPTKDEQLVRLVSAKDEQLVRLFSATLS